MDPLKSTVNHPANPVWMEVDRVACLEGVSHRIQNIPTCMFRTSINVTHLYELQYATIVHIIVKSSIVETCGE